MPLPPGAGTVCDDVNSDEDEVGTVCADDFDSDDCLDSTAGEGGQEECEDVQREHDGREDEEDAGLDVMLEAFCDPSRPGEKPTGPALKAVVCTVSSVCVDSIEVLPADATSSVLRVLSGKKIRLTIIRSATGGRHPRLEILFAFHQMTALRFTVAEEDGDELPMLEFDVCLPPDFAWNKDAKGRTGWERGVPDFTQDAIATSGARWSFALEKVNGDKMMEMLCSCRRVKLMLSDGFPAAAKDCGEDGPEIFRGNKIASIGSTQLPINADPVGALQRCNALLVAPDESFKFACFNCALQFTQQDVRCGAFTHWYTKER